jgi:hypothetical protein
MIPTLTTEQFAEVYRQGLEDATFILFDALQQAVEKLETCTNRLAVFGKKLLKTEAGSAEKHPARRQQVGQATKCRKREGEHLVPPHPPIYRMHTSPAIVSELAPMPPKKSRGPGQSPGMVPLNMTVLPTNLSAVPSSEVDLPLQVE